MPWRTDRRTAAPVAPAMRLGHQRGDRAEQADQKQIDRKEDRGPHCHRRQVDGTDPPGHDRIDKAHGGLRELSQDQRSGQPEEDSSLVEKKRKGAHGGMGRARSQPRSAPSR